MDPSLIQMFQSQQDYLNTQALNVARGQAVQAESSSGIPSWLWLALAAGAIWYFSQKRA